MHFSLNGQSVSIGIDERMTLLDFLRSRGLTGAKEGCAEGECGACTVVLVAPCGNGRSEYRPVNSCLMLLPAAADHEVLTVEGLAARGELHEAQRALADAGGSQCGYCTPGFVMSLFAEQYRPDRQGPCDPLALSGNLCRCTGYRPIRDAALGLGPPPAGPYSDRLARPAPVLSSIDTRGDTPGDTPGETPRFSRPTSLDRALDILDADPRPTVVAGGSDIAVDWNLRWKRPTHLLSLEAIPELRLYAETAESVTIGAALPLTDVGRTWSSAPAAFHEWLELFASPPIRNRATLGGNLVTASPIGDAAPLLAALDAVVHVVGPGGRRGIPLSSFFTSYRRTTMGAGELVAAIEVPKPYPARLRFYKVSKRRLDDISTVAAGLALDLDRSGRIQRARFAFGGIAATPTRLREAEYVVTGQPWNREAVVRVQEMIDRTLTPISDLRGSKEYRREVAKQLVEKFWWETSA